MRIRGGEKECEGRMLKERGNKKRGEILHYGPNPNGKDKIIELKKRGIKFHHKIDNKLGKRKTGKKKKKQSENKTLKKKCEKKKKSGTN